MSVDFSLRQIEYFVEAARLGTISAAAERCNTSQTGVSLGVVELERRLGVQLFVRRKAKGVVLTEAGTRILSEARALLAQAENMESSARSEGQEISGRVSFGCPTTLAPFIIPQLLDDFCRAHPSVSVSTLEGSAEVLRRAILDGECDVAMMYSVDGIPGLDYHKIQTVKPYLLLPAGHPMAKNRVVSLRDIAHEPLIAPLTPAGVYSSEAVMLAAGIQPVFGPRSNNIEMIRALVGRGLGYSILVQRWPGETSYEGRPLVTREIKEPIPDTSVFLSWAKGTKITKRMEALMDYCVKRFTSTP